MSDDWILVTEQLTKEFRGFVAVAGIDLKVRRGTIHALIGPNGAGKTTVFNLLTRFLPATRGKILYNGQEITDLRPADVARRGVVRSFQVSAVFPKMTVLENVRVALQRKLGTSFHFWKREATLQPLEARARELLAEVDLQEFASTLAVELPYGRKRSLELATTLALEPELLLLDEPTQGMGHEDVGRVTALIEKVAQKRTVLMVEHNLSVVAELSDTITVLARGSVLAEGTYEEVSKNPAVLEAYIGVAE
jgi:branched-chain amino acid transport system ATP-binding protein